MKEQEASEAGAEKGSEVADVLQGTLGTCEEGTSLLSEGIGPCVSVVLWLQLTDSRHTFNN